MDFSFSLMYISHLALISPNVHICSFLAHSQPFNLQFSLPVWGQNMVEGQVLGKTEIWKFNFTRASRDSLCAWLKLYCWSGEYNVSRFSFGVFSSNKNGKCAEPGRAMRLCQSRFKPCVCNSRKHGHLTSTMTLKGPWLLFKRPRL